MITFCCETFFVNVNCEWLYFAVNLPTYLQNISYHRNGNDQTGNATISEENIANVSNVTSLQNCRVSQLWVTIVCQISTIHDCEGTLPYCELCAAMCAHNCGTRQDFLAKDQTFSGFFSRQPSLMWMITFCYEPFLPLADSSPQPPAYWHEKLGWQDFDKTFFCPKTTIFKTFFAQTQLYSKRPMHIALIGGSHFKLLHLNSSLWMIVVHFMHYLTALSQLFCEHILGGNIHQNFIRFKNSIVHFCLCWIKRHQRCR